MITALQSFLLHPGRQNTDTFLLTKYPNGELVWQSSSAQNVNLEVSVYFLRATQRYTVRIMEKDK